MENWLGEISSGGGRDDKYDGEGKGVEYGGGGGIGPVSPLDCE